MQLVIDIDRELLGLWVLLEWPGMSLQITEGNLKCNIAFICFVSLI